MTSENRPLVSPEDQRRLIELDRKLQLVRDRVAGVATGRHTGFFLGGRGGIGKSYTVEQELTRLKVAFKLWNSAVTARCLFDYLAAFPGAVHVFEDVEGICKDRRCIGVLRSALWGTRRGRDGKMERLVTWNARGANEEVVFAGGIVMTSNRPLADLPELNALKTRISWLSLDISDTEVAALMRSYASRGYPADDPQLDAEQCMEVVDFILREASRINCRLDMRLLVNSLEDRLQVDDLDAGCSWQDLVAARISERPTVVDEIEPVGVRTQKKAKQLAVAREILEFHSDERSRVWKEKTGASQATMYRRLAELGQLDALSLEN